MEQTCSILAGTSRVRSSLAQATSVVKSTVGFSLLGLGSERIDVGFAVCSNWITLDVDDDVA
jgi:hypothetical protein